MSRVSIDPTEALKEIPLFSTLSAEDLGRIAGGLSRVYRFKKGSVIFQEGDPGDHLLLTLVGRAKVVLQRDTGREVILSVIEPPAVLGYIALLDGAARSATVIACDAIEARKLSREHFLDLVARNRQVLEGLLRDLAARLRDTNEQVRTTLMFDVHGQVLRALVRLGKDGGDGQIVVRPRPTHDEIGEMIGKSRETVSRALKQLKEAGYLTTAPQTFVLKKDKLKRYWRPNV